MTEFDPHTLDRAIIRTAAEALEADDVYQKSLALAQAVQDLHGIAHESPRWANLWDQAARSSSGVLLSYSEGLGKLRGFTNNSWLCARGELTELYATLTLGPDSFKALKDDARELYRLLDERLLQLAPAPCDKLNKAKSRWGS